LENQKFTFKNNELITINSEKSMVLLVTENIILLLKYTVEDIIKNYKAELFILFELTLIFLFFIIFFVIFPDPSLAMSGTIIKLRKARSLNIWNTIEFNMNYQIFTKELFEKFFNRFWNNIYEKLNESNHMFILFKVKYQGSEYTTIGNLQRLNLSDKDWYINWIINNMIYKSEYYNETPIESIIFSYGFKDEIVQVRETFKTDLNFQNFKNNKLVISYNPLDYGKLINQINYENYSLYILQTKDNLIVRISKYDNYNQIEILSGGDIIVKFRDEFISDNKFIRILDNKKYYFENNQQILYTKEKKTKFISKLAQTKILNNNFITLDIETYIKDGILIPYVISIYDGKMEFTFSIWEYNNHEQMILTALKSIMIRKYNDYNVYIHNMAKFDIIFLLKYLVKLGAVQPIIHNGKIISIKLNFGEDNKYNIQFKDSYLLLLNSLMKLSRSFKVETQKSVFPHLFVNENNLSYIGEVPEFKYFDKISNKDYNEYKSKFNYNWNLKEESLKYCKIDCISLYQVIYKFADMIFDLFLWNIHHYSTLPSLAFAIFRSRFMTENIIPQISGKIAKDIRQSYTGGAVDVYIPENKKGTEVYCYDVNSLYPSVMSDNLMPIGTPTYFEGDIRKIDKDAFGFFYCNIVAPEYLEHPIIQTHVKTTNGIRTIAPLGQGSDMIFSVEMDNAVKLGYKFEILWGYTFQSDYIFNEYVDFLYTLRLNYPKDDPLNFIAKILLNSLYGRFGMDDNFTEVNIIHKDYFSDFENKYLNNILETQDLGDYKLIIYNQINNKNENEEVTHNVSIGIASAITAYARIHMSQFKNNPNLVLYYSDTDSAYVDRALPISMVNAKTLGKLKLENVLTKAIFLAPKVYCLETNEEKLIYKVKGLSHSIELTLKDFEQLLFKESLLQNDKLNDLEILVMLKEI